MNGTACRGGRSPATCTLLDNAPQAHQKRIHELENEAAALRAELERKDEQLTAAAARQRQSQQQVAELQQELENNAGAMACGIAP